jgi:hypothetical protein
MPDNVKKLVRTRMQKTGESYQTAQRHVREQAPTDRTMTPMAIAPSQPRHAQLGSRTFYLDQSTLCDAFRAHCMGPGAADPHYRPLYPWIERVATEANLCISLTHLVELAKLTHLPTADGIAKWLDGLPLVWTRSFPRIIQQEYDVWTRIAAAVPSVAVQPFSQSLLATFDTPTPNDVSSFLRNAPRGLPGMLGAVRQAWANNNGRWGGLVPGMARGVREDRAEAVARGKPDPFRRERIDDNQRAKLRRLAMDADRRLTENADVAYAAKAYTSNEVLDRFIEQYQNDPRSLPLQRAHGLHVESLLDGVGRRTPGSSRDRDLLSGAMEDGMHLVGAAYCDVFTCDRITSNALGDFRTTIGRMPQLAIGGYPGGVEAFVRDLMATWP